MFQTGAPKASLVDLNVLSVPSQSTSAGIAAGYHYTCLSVMHLKNNVYNCIEGNKR